MSSDSPVPKLQRYCIKTDAVSAEKVWDFVQQSGLAIYERGGSVRSSRKYEYEVYMREEEFLAFRLTHPNIKIFHMAEKEAVEDLMVTHYIDVVQAEVHDTMVRIRRLLGPACVVQLTSNSPATWNHVKIKVIVTEGSEEENLLLLTFGHLKK
jgi:hypothetical protein